MTRTDRRGFLAGAAAAVLLAGGERRRLAAGDPRPPVEGGIGGTGIVGVVTALGSVVVGGQRVALPPEASVADALGPREPGSLGVGHSLTVEAAMTGAGLAARRVRVTHPVIGTVDDVSADGRALRVAGVSVTLAPGVAARAGPGDRVAVSGLWRAGGVVASRLDRADAGADVIAGDVRRGTGGATLNGLALAAPGLALPPDGSFATAFGRAGGGRFRAERIEPGRFTGAAGPLARLVVEGYLVPVDTPPAFRIAGLGHSFDRAARVGPLAGVRAIFVGPYSGTFDVARALPLPEDAAERRRLLGPGLDLGAAPGAVPTR